LCEQAQNKIYFNAEHVTIKLSIHRKSCTTFTIDDDATPHITTKIHPLSQHIYDFTEASELKNAINSYKKLQLFYM